MPFYEYNCAACNYHIEIQQGINDPPLSMCTECGSDLRKIIFPPHVIYKGRGFYATEYGKKKESGLEKALSDDKKKQEKK